MTKVKLVKTGTAKLAEIKALREALHSTLGVTKQIWEEVGHSDECVYECSNEEAKNLVKEWAETGGIVEIIEPDIPQNTVAEETHENRTKSNISIMCDFVAGKKIEYKQKGSAEWKDCPMPNWNWTDYDYRVKPKQKLRPYNSAKEFLEAQKQHGWYIKDKGGVLRSPCTITQDTIKIFVYNDLRSITYKNLLEEGKLWQDGTPCGIVEE